MANARPVSVAGAAADAAHRSQRRSAEFAKAAVGERLDLGNALKNRLKVDAFVGGARREAWRQIWVRNGKPLARPRQGIEMQAGRLVGLHSCGEITEIGVGKQMLDDL